MGETYVWVRDEKGDIRICINIRHIAAIEVSEHGTDPELCNILIRTVDNRYYVAEHVKKTQATLALNKYANVGHAIPETHV